MMSLIQFTLFLGFLIFGTTEAGFMLRSGKCRTFDIKPVPVDLHYLASLKEWKIIYATDTYTNMDHEYRDAYTLGDNLYRVDDTRIYKDRSRNQYTFMVEYIDNVIYEDSFDDYGNRKRFYLYPLGLTSENAMLYYRCSDTGPTDIDTRIIEIPRNETLSDAGLQQLLDIDRTYGFRGDLVQLPYSLP